MAGTFNGNPLTMAASRACLTEVLTQGRRTEQLDRVHRALAEGCGAAIDEHRLPAYVAGMGAKGSCIYRATPVHEYRDSVGIDERITYLAWLFQQNRGVFKSPWSKQETWTTSVSHTEDDAAPLRRELRGVRGGDRLVTAAADRPSRSRTGARSRRSRRAIPTACSSSSTTAARAPRSRSRRSTARRPSAGSGS